jgi:glycosyltransferase involved in cell wall biosynthesis
VRILLAGTGVQPIPPPGYGGIERVLAEYAGALRSRGHDPIVVNRVRHGRMRDEYPFAGELLRAARRTDYDVLHASTPVVANRLSLAHLRFCYTTHSRHWFFRNRLSHRWGYWLERRAVRHAAAVVALTSGLQRQMSRVIPAERMPPLEVIPIGVDPQKFQPAWERRQRRYALGVGVVASFKRWEIAAAALRGSGLALRIAGPIPDPGYADLIRRAGDRVELLGEVPEEALRGLYAESDLLVHPSEVELLAGAVVQGLAAGLPVLGCAPVADQVIQGETGWATPPNAPSAGIIAAWRAWIAELNQKETLFRQMGEAARAQALDRYSWSRVVDDHIALYRRMRGGS